MLILRVVAIALLLLGIPTYAAQTAFVNVNVVAMTSETVAVAQTVVVEGRKIVTIGDVDDIPIAEGAVIVDGGDRFLMPSVPARFWNCRVSRLCRMAQLAVSKPMQLLSIFAGR